MKIITSDYEIMSDIDGKEILKNIERTARTCYKSEDKIKEGSAERLVKNLVNRGHEAMLEHVSISVKIFCDRAIANEWVRHRIASYAQESTRYINYKDKDMEFIVPKFNKQNAKNRTIVEALYRNAEKTYKILIQNGATPQEARCVLPLGLKTEFVCTMNLRSWRNFFKLRCAPDAHLQIREIATAILKEFKEEVPIIFDDIK